jgi:hypothetical protein
MTDIAENVAEEAFYSLNIVGGDADAPTTFGSVSGNIDEIAYTVKQALRRMKASDFEEFSARLVQTIEIEGEEYRSVSSLTADLDTLNIVLKKKITAERKANRPAVEADETESVESTDVPHPEVVEQDETRSAPNMY